jgi:hypothetical protein
MPRRLRGKKRAGAQIRVLDQAGNLTSRSTGRAMSEPFIFNVISAPVISGVRLQWEMIYAG